METASKRPFAISFMLMQTGEVLGLDGFKTEEIADPVESHTWRPAKRETGQIRKDTAGRSSRR